VGTLAFLVTIAFVSPFPDGALAPRWVVLSIAVPGLLLCLPRLPRLCFGHWLFGAFWCVCGLSILWTPDVFDGLYIYWGFTLFGGLLLTAPSDLRPIFIGAGCALAINSVFVLLQVLGYEPVTQAVPPAGLFFNKNVGAEATALVIVGLLCSRPAEVRGPGWRGMLLAGAGSVPLLVPPHSRGAILAFCVAVTGWLWSKHRFIGILVAILAVGLLSRLAFDISRWESSSSRLAFWVNALGTSNFWGHGLGSFRWTYPWFEYAHNDLIQLLFEVGVPGLLLFCLFLGYCLRHGALSERLVLTAFIVEGFFGFPLYSPVTTFLVACTAGSVLRRRCAVRVPLDRGERPSDACFLDTRSAERADAYFLPARRRSFSL